MDKRDSPDHSLDEEQERFATLAELVDGGVFVLDDDGRITKTNETFVSMLGVESTRLTDTPVTEFLALSDRKTSEIDESGVSEVLTELGETTPELTVWAKTATGAVEPFSLSAERVGDEFVCVCQRDGPGRDDDSAYRKGQDETVGASNGQPLNIDAIGDPVYILAADGTVEQVNDALLAFTGYERDDVVGRNMTELVPASEHNRLSEQVIELAENPDRDARTLETELLTSDGELVLVATTITAHTDPDGQYAGTVGTVRDIREHKQRERDLELLKQVLTRVFRHNVRNELMVAKSHAELLEDEVDTALTSHTNEIRQAADRILGHSDKVRLIEDVIETDERQELDLVEAIRNSVKAVTPDYPAATVEVDLPESASVVAHPSLFYGIEELLENALQHAPETTEPSVEVWLEQQTEKTTLFVEDDSGGLSEHELQVLRAGSETELEHSSGVGLWLIRWLVEYSDAELVVHRTDTGTIMGIQFRPATSEVTEHPYSPLNSPFAPAPDEIREREPEQFRGDIVVGRVEARRQLEEIYETLSRSGGHSVVVSGEAGIGKTTFVQQVLDRLETFEDAPLVATGSCRATVQSPYQPFKEVLEDLPVEKSFETIRADAGGFDAADETAARKRKQALFADVAEQLRTVVDNQPVLVLVEDMHWAGDGTVDLFEYLADELGRWSHPVLFLCTYRTSDVDESHPVLDIVDDATETGRGTVIDLEPLGFEEVDALLRDFFDVGSVPSSFVEAVLEHTGGNPLFVTEVGRHLLSEYGPVEQGEQLPTALDEQEIPATVEQAIDERLAAIPTDVESTLELGAVLGDSFTFDLLREASDVPPDVLIDHVDVLVDRQLWVRSEETIEFVHGVIRDRAHEAINRRTSRQLHERAIQAIERAYGDSLDEHAGRLAQHYEHVGNYEMAFQYYRDAGEIAKETYANDEAINHYEQALATCRDHLDRAESTLASLHADVAEVYWMLGDSDGARTHLQQGFDRATDRSETYCRLLGVEAGIELDQGSFDEARARAREQRDLAKSLSVPKFEARALLKLGRVAERQGDYEQSHDQLRQSLTISESCDDEQTAIRCLANLGVVSIHQAAYERATEYLAQSLARARDFKDRQAQARALHLLGASAYYQGEYDDATAYYERSLETHRTTGNRSGEAELLHALALNAFDRAEYDRATERYERSIEIKRQLGDKHGEAKSLGNLGIIAQHRGEYDRARELYERSVSILSDIGAKLGETKSRHNLGLIALEQGEYERAMERFEESLERKRELDVDRPQVNDLLRLGQIASERGAKQRARKRFERALDIATATEDDRGLANARLNLATLARRQEEFQRASAHVEVALEQFDEMDDRFNLARAYLEASKLALAQGSLEEAGTHLDEATARFERLSARHYRARCLVVRGRLAAKRDDTKSAHEHWQAALETFESVGAPQDALDVLQLLVESTSTEELEQQTRTWCEHAQTILEEAPEDVRSQHQSWVDRHSSSLGLENTDS